MLSFFSKRKSNVEADEVIQGPANPQSQPAADGSDEFIFVEPRKNQEPTNPQSSFVYPPMPPPLNNGQFGYPSSTGGTATNTQTPYLQGVPFVMAPQLCTKNSFESVQCQVDGILAIMTRQISLKEQDQYNFNLERSIQNDIY